MNNTIKTEVTDLCGDLLKYTAILKQQQRCKKKNKKRLGLGGCCQPQDCFELSV